MNKIAFIIQARLGSTRLPKKIILPFYEERSIIEIMINKLQNNFQYPIILATTKNALDDKLVEICNQHQISCFRGDENDVLKRFVSATEEFGIKTVVRICSDNPFLSVNYIAELLEHWNDNLDYASYCLSDGTPSILTHYGFWTEIVNIDALRKANELLNESDKDREHVTSFIYKNPNKFRIRLVPIPNFIEQTKDIRLTLDSKEDFEVQKLIYNELVSKDINFDVPEIINFLIENPEFFTKMKKEIIKNSKK